MAYQVTPVAGLRELVQRYHVCWEVWPERVISGGRSTQVGFELELSGSDDSIEEFQPSCAECLRIHAALEAIARWMLENSEGVCIEISSGDQSLHYSPARRNRPDVTLSTKILHQSGYENPVDDRQRNCLERVRGRLRELGACERQWYAAENNHEKVLATT